MTTTTTLITTAISLIPVGCAAYWKLREVLAPLLARKGLRVGVLIPSDPAGAAASFAATLRKQGYGEVLVTGNLASLADRAVIVVWCPSIVGTGLLCEQLVATAPEAVYCVLTFSPLQGVPRSDKWLLSNSSHRLSADLAALAETLAV